MLIAIAVLLGIAAMPALLFSVAGARGLMNGDLSEDTTILGVSLLWLSVIVALGFLGLILK